MGLLMTEINSHSQKSMTLRSWLAQQLRQLKSSRMWRLQLEHDTIESLISGEKAVIQGRVERNPKGYAEQLLTIRRLSAERWQIQFPDDLVNEDFLRVVVTNFSFSALPAVETEYQLPDLTRAIRHWRKGNPDELQRIPRQMAAAGEKSAGPEVQGPEPPCRATMDPHTLEYRITSSTSELWAVVELACLGRDGETLTQRHIHQLKPNLHSPKTISCSVPSVETNDMSFPLMVNWRGWPTSRSLA